MESLALYVRDLRSRIAVVLGEDWAWYGGLVLVVGGLCAVYAAIFWNAFH